MKRYRIVNKFRFTLFVTVCLVLFVFIAGSVLGYFDVRGVHDPKCVEVRVTSGDTLWNLAKAYGPVNADTRRVIYEIKQINGVSAETLRAGQVLLIPTVL